MAPSITVGTQIDDSTPSRGALKSRENLSFREEIKALEFKRC